MALPLDPWKAAFGADLNIGVQDVTAVVGNGLKNYIGGDVTTKGYQDVGDDHGGRMVILAKADGGHDYACKDPCQPDGGHDYNLPDINIGVQTVTAAVANGAFNSVCGDVTTSGYQEVGDYF